MKLLALRAGSKSGAQDVSRSVSCRALALAAATLGVMTLGWAQSAAAQSVILRVTLQPDCFRPSLTAACDPRKNGDKLDLGPQIAIWIEGADGSRFVDTVLVTNLTAVLGLGNRPGAVTLPSGPKFPYGRRLMALPVWAKRRGELYDSVVMQDGTSLDHEYWLGFHEVASSPDPYYCRPMTPEEVDVDAISCPTRRFNSVKGRFFDPARDAVPPNVVNGVPQPFVPPAKSYYPPRNDLTTFIVNDCDEGTGSGCPTSSKRFAAINDLDMVAAATPPYGQPFSKLWLVPDALPEGDYAVLVEISKEFDVNASHIYPAHVDPQLEQWGLKRNFGQPSVVYRVPFHLSRTSSGVAATSTLAGYGDPQGATGDLHPPDSTISDLPGSGAGRLLLINQPPAPGAAPLSGRVLVSTEVGGVIPPPPPPEDAGTGPGPVDADVPDAAPVDDAGAPPAPPCVLSTASPLVVAVDDVSSESATISFVEPADPIWSGILQYEIRRWNGLDQTDVAFLGGLPVATVDKVGPGQRLTVSVPNLKSEIQYSVGARPMGACGMGPVAYAALTTRLREFTMLSGCFIATAAYGSPLARDVALLRRVRDRASAGHGVAAAAADVYARSSPPAANLLGQSQAARAVARRLLAPLVELARAFDR
jgi:hypothetical protein